MRGWPRGLIWLVEINSRRAIFQSSGQIADFDQTKLSIFFGHKSEKFSGLASSIGLTFFGNLVKGIAVNLRQVSHSLLENRKSLTRISDSW